MGFILYGFKLDDYTQVAWSMCGFFLLVCFFPFLSDIVVLFIFETKF